MLTRIHVNQHNIKKNAKDNGDRPVITVKTYKSNIYCHAVKIHGPSEVIYDGEHPLSCGARVWIETEAEVDAYVKTEAGQGRGESTEEKSAVDVSAGIS